MALIHSAATLGEREIEREILFYCFQWHYICTLEVYLDFKFMFDGVTGENLQSLINSYLPVLACPVV